MKYFFNNFDQNLKPVSCYTFCVQKVKQCQLKLKENMNNFTSKFRRENVAVKGLSTATHMHASELQNGTFSLPQFHDFVDNAN